MVAIVVLCLCRFLTCFLDGLQRELLPRSRDKTWTSNHFRQQLSHLLQWYQHLGAYGGSVSLFFRLELNENDVFLTLVLMWKMHLCWYLFESCEASKNKDQFGQISRGPFWCCRDTSRLLIFKRSQWMMLIPSSSIPWKCENQLSIEKLSPQKNWNKKKPDELCPEVVYVYIIFSPAFTLSSLLSSL